MRQLSNYNRRLAFSPADLRPQLWLEAGRLDTLFTTVAGTTTPADTGTVGRWLDLSVNGFDMTATADDTTRPTWNANSGLPYLNFDGTNDLLRRTADLGCFSAVGCSMFFAIRPNPSTNRSLFALGNSADADTLYTPYSNASTATTGAFFHSNDNGVGPLNATTLQTSAFTNTDCVYGILDNGSTVAPSLNGVLGAESSAYTRGAAFTCDRTTLCAQIKTTTGSWFATRMYAAVIVNRRLNTEEVAKLTTYLGKTMGLPL